MTVRLNDFEENAWWVGRGYLAKGSWEHNGSHRHSIYRSPFGIAEVDEYPSGRTPITAIRFTWNGKQHTRRWETTWGDRTLARLAREMIEEIAR